MAHGTNHPILHIIIFIINIVPLTHPNFPRWIPCARLDSSVATTQSLIGRWFGKCTGLQLQGVLAKSEEYLFFVGSLI